MNSNRMRNREDVNEPVPKTRPPLSKTRRAFCKNSPCFVVDLNPDGPPIKMFYWGHGRVSLWPFWLCFTALLSYIPYFFIYLRPVLPEESRKFWTVIYLIPLISAAINFFLTHWLNPGFLPWTWSETRKKNYTTEEMREGVASTEEQWAWAAEQDRPERSAFSRTCGYFVLRADHDCFWVNNWIGIRNHSYFLRAVYSGFAFAIITTYLSGRIWWEDKIPVSRHVFNLMFVLPIGLGIMNGIQVWTQSINACANETILEILKGTWRERPNHHRKSCLRNWEEICGSRWCLPCWLLPVPIPKVEDGFGYLPPPSGEIESAFLV